MVNLLSFKERAEYEDGRDTDLSGREAYNLYGAAVSRLIVEYGGEIVFVGDVTFLSLGQVDELWDEVAIARYPNRGALLAMSSSPEWCEAAVHRTAGLAGQLNIETVNATTLQMKSNFMLGFEVLMLLSKPPSGAGGPAAGGA